MCVGHDPREEPQRLLARRHRNQGPGHLLRIAVGFARHALPGNVNLETGPPERAPEERLDHPDCLDATVGDGLVAALEQAAVEADDVSSLTDGEIKILVECTSNAKPAHDQDGDRALGVTLSAHVKPAA